jgi:chromosome segregation ATPase
MAREDIKSGETKHISSIKERLRNVADEIDTIKDSFSKNTQDLTKIQSMLDIGNLEEISGVIENFESRISEMEKKREEAVEGAKRYSEELEKEKERLIKLWDAYKNQEEELSNTEKRIAEFENKMRETEASKRELESDLTARINTLNVKLEENENKAREFDEYKNKCEEFDSVRDQLESEVHGLKNDLDIKDQTINSMQKQVDELEGCKEYAEYKDKFDDLSVQYEKEKERLTKLYHLYEETEAECKNLKEEVKNWEKWFDSNREIFDRLFSMSPPGAAKEISTSVPPMAEGMPETKTKRKLRFRR